MAKDFGACATCNTEDVELDPSTEQCTNCIETFSELDDSGDSTSPTNDFEKSYKYEDWN
jgi:hypothetical protein